jgi:alkylation response protein AidB-like acyl-CoA dehydrogenase
LISFRPTEEEKQFADVAKEFAEDIRTAARDCEAAGSASEALCQKAEALGFTAMELPETADGLELPLASQAQILEALTFGDLSVVQGLPGPNDADSLIRTADQAGLADQAAVLAGGRSAFIDTLLGEQLRLEQLKLTSAGDGYKLSGVSRPVRGAKTAQRLFVAAADENGQTVVLTLTGDGSSAPWQVQEGDVRLGLLSAGVARIAFEDAAVPASAVVAKGEPADTWLKWARARVQVLQAARCVGLMQAAVEYTTMYTAGRKAFGQEIAKFQGVSFTVADMAIETAAARNLTWFAAVQLDDGEAEGVASAKLACARAHRSLRFVTDNAVQMLGGHGFVQEYPVEKWMRDGEAQAVLYGRETERLIEFGEELLGKGGAAS